MAVPGGYSRLNIYLEGPDLREKIRVAAARQGVSLSTYCLEAVRERLVEEGYLPSSQGAAGPRSAAKALDRLRRQVGPIGVPVRDLVQEGRRQ